jgi:hypothetical protein
MQFDCRINVIFYFFYLLSWILMYDVDIYFQKLPCILLFIGWCWWGWKRKFTSNVIYYVIFHVNLIDYNCVTLQVNHNIQTLPYGHNTLPFFYLHSKIVKGLSSSWSYGSWIYNYLFASALHRNLMVTRRLYIWWQYITNIYTINAIWLQNKCNFLFFLFT